MYKEERDAIFRKLKEGLPEFWDGKESIRFMKDEGCRQWRQMEWPGFYFQFMCETILSEDGFMDIPGPKYGKVEFDGFKSIPWDFKAHSIPPSLVAMVQIPIIGKYKRRLTVREAARLQDFPESFIPNENDQQAYKQF